MSGLRPGHDQTATTNDPSSSGEHPSFRYLLLKILVVRRRRWDDLHFGPPSPDSGSLTPANDTHYSNGHAGSHKHACDNDTGNGSSRKATRVGVRLTSGETLVVKAVLHMNNKDRIGASLMGIDRLHRGLSSYGRPARAGRWECRSIYAQTAPVGRTERSCETAKSFAFGSVITDTSRQMQVLVMISLIKRSYSIAQVARALIKGRRHHHHVACHLCQHRVKL